jgi:hypothetical protein
VTGVELDELVRRFHACEVPKPEWTHAAHLSVGLWRVSRYGDPRAHCRDCVRAESADARLGWVEPDLAPLALDAVFERRAG